MSDEILKAYGARRKIDEVLEILDFDPKLGFNPFHWVTRNPSFLQQHGITAEEVAKLQREYATKNYPPLG